MKPTTSNAAPNAKQPAGSQNEGEGNHTAARNYDAAVEKTVKSGNVERLGKEAARAVDGPDGKVLRAAEENAKRGPEASIAARPSHDSLERATDEGMPEPPPAKKPSAGKG